MIRILSLVLCCLCAAVAQDGKAGSDACKTCHADKSFTFYRNPHAKVGCEGCHGGGRAHIEAGGGKTTIPITGRTRPGWGIS
jgi:hypothetical protein